eukprot:scaffold1435_cov267-Pinguiococcus_pyrenoidosus.AAC.13
MRNRRRTWPLGHGDGRQDSRFLQTIPCLSHIIVSDGVMKHNGVRKPQVLAWRHIASFWSVTDHIRGTSSSCEGVLPCPTQKRASPSGTSGASES